MVQLFFSVFILLLEVVNLTQLNTTCQTVGCYYTVNKIMDNMNSTVNPCDDFYEFACGGYLTSSEIISNTPILDTFYFMTKSLDQHLKNILSNDNTSEEIETFKLARKFYADCLTAGYNYTYWFKRIFKIIEHLGGWPVTTPHWKAKNFSLIDLVTKARRIGFDCDFLWRMGTSIFPYNTSENILVISPPKTALMRYSNSEVNLYDSKYFRIMVNLAKKLSTSVDTEKIQSKLFNVYSLEVKLTKEAVEKFFKPRKSNIEPTQSVLTFSELQTRYPLVDWIQYVTSDAEIENNKLSESTKIMLLGEEYFNELLPLIESTSDTTLADYFIWQILWDGISFDVPKLNQPRWKHCLTATRQSWQWVIPSMYVKYRFDKEIKEDVVNIANAIKTEMKESILKSKWLDDVTRKKALEKLNSLLINVGYPDIVTDEKKLVEYYKDVKDQLPDNYYESFMTLKRFHMKLIMNRINEPNPRYTWPLEIDPLEVNAMYSQNMNAIFIPVAFLSKHVYSKDLPYYMKFSAVGSVIGHEISHSFDSEGSKFDKNGNLCNWWSNITKQEFKKRIKCFIQQYNKYNIYGTKLQINGTLTITENTADNEGMRSSYNAYKNWVRKNGPESKLPLLNFTDVQSFWISTAQFWCAKYDPHILKVVIQEVHSPHKYRIIGSLSNQKFGDDFHCPKDSPMNPVKKCSLWC